MIDRKIDIEKIRFIKFAIVGISGTIVDFGIFNLLILFFNQDIIHAESFDYVLISSMISFIVAVFNNYYWNRQWTYPESKEFSHKEQFIKFGTVSVLGLLIRTPLFAYIKNPIIGLTEGFLLVNSSFSSETVGNNFALALVVIIVLFWNYFINRFWTYRKIK